MQPDETSRGESHLDSRDLIARAEYLREQDDPDDDEREELAAIEELSEAGVEDWEHGAHFIADHAFKDYAEELAEDIGAIPKDAGWPARCIDWDQAADELKQDYTSVSFLGTDYWVR